MKYLSRQLRLEGTMTSPKRIGFLSFGAWHPGGGLTHTGGDALSQTVDLAVAA
jgi:hypothetical protein